MMAADLHRAWRELPIGNLTDVAGAGACLILAPHPDDESLGCGGLIAALCQAGRPPVVAVLTDGAGSHPGSHDWPPESLREVRSQEVRTAAALLGLPADRLVLLRQPDSHAPHPGDDAFDAGGDACSRHGARLRVRPHPRNLGARPTLRPSGGVAHRR